MFWNGKSKKEGNKLDWDFTFTLHNSLRRILKFTLLYIVSQFRVLCLEIETTFTTSDQFIEFTTESNEQ